MARDLASFIPDDSNMPEALRKRQEESDGAHAALIAYYQMGPGRSTNGLVEYFTELESKGVPVPTTNPGTITVWRSRHKWDERIYEVVAMQTAQELAAFQEMRIDYLKKQVDVLSKWSNMLKQSEPDLEEVGFSEWTRSAKEFVKAVSGLFGFETAKEVNINVKRQTDESRDIDSGEAVGRLVGLIESVRERARLDAVADPARAVDVEGRPVEQGSKGK